MKQSARFFDAVRLAGLLAVLLLGLVSIIGTGDGGSGSSSAPDETRTYYRDRDGDGYGDPEDYARFSSPPLGEYVTDRTDCLDSDRNISPGAPEICGDNIDNNCDDRIDVDCAFTDMDGDGAYAETGTGAAEDCNDADAAIRPGAEDICWDNIDNNCDGQVDEGCVPVCTDADNDGYYGQGDCGTPVDCNDTAADIHPGAVEPCGDGLDNDCDGQVDEGCQAGLSPVPDTGQTTCYDNDGRVITCPAAGRTVFGQDACYTINPPSYTRLRGNANNEFMAQDNVTGLIWELKTDDGGIHDKDDRYSWYNALNIFIATLNADQYGGYSDWRIPTQRELLSIVDYDTYNPAIDTSAFPNTIASYYWAYPTYADNPGGSSCINFLYGQDFDLNNTTTYYVRAVRGNQNPSSFTDNGDGTVADNTTGLMWSQVTDMTPMNWQAALAWCENLSLAGYEDWRLPTLKELASIVDDDVDGLAIDSTYFPDTMSAYYWSSTSNAYDPDHAWLISFSLGNNGQGSKYSTYYVRAVRGGRGSVF
jgi:hypothetical protein